MPSTHRDAIRNDTGAEVAIHDLWKVYGPHPKRFVDQTVSSADEHELTLQDGHTAAVRQVSLNVRPGETFVIMGLSGSGKSTLIRCLSRLVDPTAGVIRVDGRPITDMSSQDLRQFRRHDCAMVFQHFGLFPHRRVIENVGYGLEVAGMRRREREKRSSDILDLVGLSGWEQRFPSELSGGMRQRVGLARALAVRPKLLLLDEPFSALDPLIRRDLQDELMRLSATTNQTSIFVTHDMAEALKIGDRIALMRAGRIVQVGTPEDIVLRPVDEYVRRFSEDAPRVRVIRARAASFEVPVVRGSNSLISTLNRIRKSDTQFAFVIDDQDHLVGTVDSTAETVCTESDLKTADLTAANAAVLKATAPLEQAIKTLSSSPRIAVVDDNNRIIGGIDPGSILRALTTNGPLGDSGWRETSREKIDSPNTYKLNAIL